ncbi:DNA repair protein RecO [Dermabacter sp. HSID17554]|uniref:DNA repair protein RecO n=1 Tax=Dermabacter sp. HSID17554 TaxID=2419511 RepID=UPI000F88CC01|nr:DNA repair protein RecO [Dermabacter sp. HSID17554]RUP87103.1 DNA repair protein RecO [Dermabacter sp. HSID17554]
MVSRLYRDDAIVLRTQDLGEADRIVTLYSKNHGKLRAVAKGVRKTSSRFGARLEPFQRVDVQCYRGRSLDTVSQVVTITAYAEQIAGDYGRYTAAAAMGEAVERLTNEGFDPTSAHYMMLVGALHALVHSGRPPVLILDAFLLRTIAMAGWRPELRRCAVCGAEGPHHAFDVAQGGVVCRDCRRPGAIAARPSVTEHMIFLLAGDWEEALATEGAAQGEAGRLIARILAYHLERPLTALDLVDRSIESAPAPKEHA